MSVLFRVTTLGDELMVTSYTRRNGKFSVVARVVGPKDLVTAAIPVACEIARPGWRPS